MRYIATISRPRRGHVPAGRLGIHASFSKMAARSGGRRRSTRQNLTKPDKDEENRGGYDCEFVEPPPPAFQTECPICLHILKEPCLISCKCGKKICRECVEPITKAKGGRPCPFCNKSDFTYMRDHGLERSLKEFEVWCSNNVKGCDWRGKLGEYEQHLNQSPSPESQLTGCQFVKVECKHKCGEWFERRHIKSHQSRQCQKRLYACEHCKDYSSTFEDVVEVHYTQCSKYPVNCPRKCQKESFARQELVSHLRDECPLTVASCPFSHAGCNVQCCRKDMPEHMKDTATHLTLLASVTQSLVKQNDTLAKGNQQLKEKLERQEKEVGKLKSALPKYSGFPKVYQVKLNKEKVYLPGFYTHHNGYKMCLRVDPYGHSSENGTHVSIYTYLMKGSYDNHLKWPFRGEITIKIVNQAGDHDHIENTLPYNDQTADKNAGRVTSGEYAVGRGFYYLLAHSDLEYNAAKKTQYLKDNQLIIHVVKVELK